MGQTVDVVVIGAGTAGVPCAIAAAEAGAEVLLLERSGKIGGTLEVAGADLSGAGSRRQIERGVLGDTPQAHFADVVRITGDTARHDLLRQSVTLAAGAIDWLIDNGLEFTERSPFIMMGHETYATARTLHPLNGGPSIVEVFDRVLDERVRLGGLTVELNATVTKLQFGEDGVTGVEYEQDGTTHVVTAGRVVLACGGYVGNHEMFRAQHGRPLTSVGMPTSMGDAITLTAEKGVKVVGGEYYLPTVGGLLGSEDSAWSRWADPRPILNSSLRSPWEIHVTRAGRRFSSEDHPSLTARQQAVHALEDLTFFVVFDERALREAPPIMPAWGTDGLREAANTAPGVFAAPTLDALAAKAGIDAAGLAATVEEYNRAVETGHDGRFARRFLPTPIAEGPFYALEIHGIALDTFGGIEVDSDLRVLSGEGKPIRGLYAVGEAIGAAAMTGQVVCSGMLVTPCISLGRDLGRKLGSSENLPGERVPAAPRP